jgi:hypothetical protein
MQANQVVSDELTTADMDKLWEDMRDANMVDEDCRLGTNRPLESVGTTPGKFLLEIDPIYATHILLKAGDVATAERFVTLRRQAYRELNRDEWPPLLFLTEYLNSTKQLREGVERIKNCLQARSLQSPLECRLHAADDNAFVLSMCETEQRRWMCEGLATSHCLQLGQS